LSPSCDRQLSGGEFKTLDVGLWPISAFLPMVRPASVEASVVRFKRELNYA
jgi:hypothetical protein